MKAGNAETIPLEEQSEVGGNSQGGLAADTSGREENFRGEGGALDSIYGKCLRGVEAAHAIW